MSEIDAEYGDVMYYREVSLTLKMEISMNEKGRVVAELVDESGFRVCYC
jgi:hypothetical protein